MYNAFISYSHAVDGKFAPSLQKVLQRIAKPIFKARALNIFRDETSLSATPHLWATIEVALSKSEYLILLASPKAATSEWVQKEVNYWLENKSVNTILIALTEGEIIWNDSRNDFDWAITNALPDNLKGKFSEEPLYVDFRTARTSEDLSLNNPDFKTKAARIASAIHGRALNELIGEDVRLQRRAIRLRNLAIFFLLGLVASTLLFAWLSNENRLQAEAQTVIAEKRLGEVIVARDSLNNAIDSIQGLIVQVTREKDTSEQRRLLAIKNELLAIQREETAKRLQFNSDMKLALNEWERGRTEEALSLVDQHKDRSKQFIWRYLNKLVRNDLAVVPVHRAMSVFLYADGQTVYTGGHDTGLQKWGIDGTLLSQITPETDLVDSIDMTADGKHLAFVQNGQVFVLNLETGKKKMLSVVAVNSVRFSPDNENLVMATDRYTVIENITSGQMRTLRTNNSILGGDSVAFIPGTDFLAMGDEKGEIMIWNLKTASRETVLSTPQGRKIYSLAASPDGKYLASATTSHGQLEVWEVANWERRKFADIYHNSPTDGMLAFSADGRYLASPDGPVIKIWELATAQLVKEYRGHNKSISSVSWAADNMHIASGSYDGTVRVWKAFGDQRFDVKKFPIETYHEEMFYGISPGKEYFAAAFTRLEVYDHGSMKHIASLGHSQPINRMLFSDKAGLVATVTGPFEEQIDWPGPELRVWNLNTAEVIAHPRIRAAYIEKLRFSPSGTELYIQKMSTDEVATNMTLDISTGVLQNTNRTDLWKPKHSSASAPWAGSRNLTESPDGLRAAASKRDDIELWPTKNEQPITLSTHKATIGGMDFSPDGKTLASITYNLLDDNNTRGELKLWDAQNGSELATFVLDGYLAKVGFTSDGSILSVITTDGTVYRFNAPKP